jgi:crotonobetainyl-CoA:carnitine CoA-transferase CaiB-like acyl-CoA transferase
MASSFNDRNGKPFCVQGINGKNWQEIMTKLGFWKMLEERGQTHLGDAVVSDEKRKALLNTLAECFATDTREKWVDFFRGEDIVSAPINTLLEASNDPDVIANQYVTWVDYPKFNKKIKVHGSPWIFSETPPKIGIAPELGADTEPILKRIGYNDAQIKEFRDKKVI